MKGFDGSEIDPLAECDELQCKPGWDGDPYNCQDVDECFDNLHEVSYFFLDGLKYDFIGMKMRQLIIFDAFSLFLTSFLNFNQLLSVI